MQWEHNKRKELRAFNCTNIICIHFARIPICILHIAAHTANSKIWLNELIQGTPLEFAHLFKEFQKLSASSKI